MNIENDLKEVKQAIKENSNKLNEIDKSLNQNAKELAVYNSQLEIHIRRSETIERQVTAHEKFLNRMLGAIIILQILIPIVVKVITKT